MFCSSPECKGQDTVTQPTRDVTAAEGDTVTLNCTFETSVTPTLFWYKQEENDFPKYLLKFLAADFLKSETRFFTQLSGEKRGVNLQISSAAVTDSAVYYCAVRPTLLEAFFPHSSTQLFISTRGPHYQVGGTLLVHCVQEKLPFKRQKPRAEPDSGWAAICLDRLG
uniref:Ig-like domain-containing protein n=1 Tax=Lates calcarifer TaxID=8187 RepID=A0A4W6CF80_LATCA